METAASCSPELDITFDKAAYAGQETGGELLCSGHAAVSYCTET